jgi:hypothetical protein
MPIPAEITRDDLLEAMGLLDAGMLHDFHHPTKHYVEHGGKFYAPKAVVGVAAEVATGAPLKHQAFSSGPGANQAVGFLKKRGIQLTTQEQLAARAGGERGYLLFSREPWLKFHRENLTDGTIFYSRGELTRMNLAVGSRVFVVMSQNDPQRIYLEGTVRGEEVMPRSEVWKKYGKRVGAKSFAEWSRMWREGNEGTESSVIQLEEVSAPSSPLRLDAALIRKLGSQKGRGLAADELARITTCLKTAAATKSGGPPWSQDEIDLILEDYFTMLRDELAGRKSNKANHNRELRQKLHDRTREAVEFKHCNISSVLADLDLPYIDGYKPRPGIQKALIPSVKVYLRKYPDVLNGPSKKGKTPKATGRSTSLELVSPPKGNNGTRGAGRKGVGEKKINYARRNAENAKTGLAGEELVLAWEKAELIKRGFNDLASKIKHVSLEEGDGLGYDIRSFDHEDGSETFIEVKTTRSGVEAAFYMSENERQCWEENPGKYRLYRVFGLGRPQVKFYVLTGGVEDACCLEPIQYRVKPGKPTV